MSAKHVVHWCLTRRLDAIDLSSSTDTRDFLACALSKVNGSPLLQVAVESHRWFGDFDYGSETGALQRLELRIVQDGDGNVYVGEVKAATEVRHGRGVYLQVAGFVELYEGWWRDGVREGRGRCSGGSGMVYDGDFLGGQWHGKGTLRLKDGTMYEGGFKASKREGEGLVTQPNGDREKGYFFDNQAIG